MRFPTSRLIRSIAAGTICKSRGDYLFSAGVGSGTLSCSCTISRLFPCFCNTAVSRTPIVSVCHLCVASTCNGSVDQAQVPWLWIAGSFGRLYLALVIGEELSETLCPLRPSHIFHWSNVKKDVFGAPSSSTAQSYLCPSCTTHQVSAE